MATRVTRHDEVERKYDIAPGLPLPELTHTRGIASLGQEETLDLEAVYFDTASRDLHRHGMSVRRRTGGIDDGWQLKLPRKGDRRTELHLPLGRAVRTVPAPLLDPIRAVVRDRPLEPVAIIRTHRSQQCALDHAGVPVVTVCDDQVDAHSLRDPDRRLTWREVEVELVEGQPARLLDRVERLLVSGGLTPGATTSKLRRILGDVAVDIPDSGAAPGRQLRPRHGRRATAAEVLLPHITDQITALHHHDRGVREGEARAVHRLRIAVRRLRSALATYEPLMVPRSTDALTGELRWLGQSMAPARDAEVLRRRLDRLLAEQPADLTLRPVARRIDRELTAAHRAGVTTAHKAITSDRYYRLLDALDALAASPLGPDRPDNAPGRSSPTSSPRTRRP